jgi:hypothetical protein
LIDLDPSVVGRASDTLDGNMEALVLQWNITKIYSLQSVTVATLALDLFVAVGHRPRRSPSLPRAEEPDQPDCARSCLGRQILDKEVYFLSNWVGDRVVAATRSGKGQPDT